MADEFLASNEFPGNGVTTLFNVSFKGNRPDAGSGTVPYLNSADVKGQIITPATPTSPKVVVDTPVTHVGPNQFSVTPAVPVGKILRLYRATQDKYALVDYQSLQTVSEADLDLSNRQLVFIVQESRDLAVRANIDAGNAAELAYEAVNTANDAAAVADKALGTANSAAGAAAAAVSTANAAVSTANAAAAAAAQASSDAADAQAAAKSVVGIATGAVDKVNAATNAANTAINTANNALAVASGISSTADAALAAASAATRTANTALSVANGIDAKAQSALDSAAAANTTANSANSTANTALTTANGIASTANTALTNANTAVTTANAASSAAAAAQTTANSASWTANSAHWTANNAMPKSGGTFTGGVSMSADAATALQPVTKQQFEKGPGYTTGSGAHMGLRNIIQNGEMVVWNRGASQTLNGTVEKFTADRWRTQVNLGSGAASASVQVLTDDEAPYQASRAYNYHRITGNVTGTAGYMLLRQPVVDLRKFSGEFTISFWARRSHAIKCGVRVSQVFGAGGSSAVSLGKTFTFAAANTWQLVTLTFDLPSMSGKTFTGTSRLEVSFEPEVGNTALGTSITGYTLESTGWGSGSSAGTFDVTCVQMESGAVATPFERRPYQDTLLDCLRYFSPTQRSIWGGYGSPSAGVWNFMPFFTKMVRVPTRNNFSAVEQANAADTVISSASELGFRTTNAVLSVAGFRVQADYNADADYYSQD